MTNQTLPTRAVSSGRGTLLLRTLLFAAIVAWGALLSSLSAATTSNPSLNDPPSSNSSAVTTSAAAEESESAKAEAAEAESKADAKLREETELFLQSISGFAVLESLRSGVPASITAAQAILESSWGRGPIATSGNNYFGIKCKTYWTGATVAYVDDDRDRSGKLIESCFRAYTSVEDSFRDHSDFLVGSERYASLFTVDPLDYKGWAHGLKACGYATDQQYANKLIALIERLELYTLDWPEEQANWLLTLTEVAEPVDLLAVRKAEFLRP